MLPATRISPRPMRELRPIVCGYLRADLPNEIEIAAWKKELSRYCRQQDYLLAAVFVDRRVPDDQVRRPGIRGLLDVLVMPGVIGVVVPDTGHLSAHAGALATLRALVEDTNSELLCMQPEPRCTEASGA